MDKDTDAKADRPCDPLTAAELEALTRLERGMTPAPWEADGPRLCGSRYAVRTRYDDEGFCSTVASGEIDPNDAAGIAALRNRARALLAAAGEAGRLRERVAVLEAALAKAANTMGEALEDCVRCNDPWLTPVTELRLGIAAARAALAAAEGAAGG